MATQAMIDMLRGVDPYQEDQYGYYDVGTDDSRLDKYGLGLDLNGTKPKGDPKKKTPGKYTLGNDTVTQNDYYGENGLLQRNQNEKNAFNDGSKTSDIVNKQLGTGGAGGINRGINAFLGQQWTPEGGKESVQDMLDLAKGTGWDTSQYDKSDPNFYKKLYNDLNGYLSNYYSVDGINDDTGGRKANRQLFEADENGNLTPISQAEKYKAPAYDNTSDFGDWANAVSKAVMPALSGGTSEYVEAAKFAKKAYENSQMGDDKNTGYDRKPMDAGASQNLLRTLDDRTTQNGDTKDSGNTESLLNQIGGNKGGDITDAGRNKALNDLADLAALNGGVDPSTGPENANESLQQLMRLDTLSKNTRADDDGNLNTINYGNSETGSNDTKNVGDQDIIDALRKQQPEYEMTQNFSY